MESKKNYRTDNKSFMLYKEWETLFSLLSDQEAGSLIRSLFAFASRGKTMQQDNTNGALQMAFLVMSQQIQRDGEKWEKTCEQRAENSKKRWEKNADASKCIQMDANNPDKEKEKDEEKETDEVKEKDTDKAKVNEKDENALRDAQEHTHTYQGGFLPPSANDVAAYCSERRNGIDAQYFVDFYTANGWKVGQTPMQDWKATVRRWEKNGFRPSASAKLSPADRPNSSINLAEVESMLGLL